MKLLFLLAAFGLAGCETAQEDFRNDFSSVTLKTTVNAAPPSVVFERTFVTRPLPSPTPTLTGTLTLLSGTTKAK